MDVYLYYLKDPITKEVRYIGQTVDPKKRLYTHCYEAATNKGSNPWKKNWIKLLLSKGLKPALEVFNFYRDITQEEVNQEELRAIQEHFDRGYRLTNTKEAPEHAPSAKTNRTRKVVYQYDLKTRNLINSYGSSKEAARTVGLSSRSISDAARGKGLRCTGGFLWSYEKHSILTEVAYVPKGRPSKKILATNTATGDETEFSSISDAALQLSLDTGNISKVCNGRRFIAGNYTFSYM